MHIHIDCGRCKNMYKHPSPMTVFYIVNVIFQCFDTVISGVEPPASLFLTLFRPNSALPPKKILDTLIKGEISFCW